MASLTYENSTRTGWRLRAYVERRRVSVWLGKVPEHECQAIKAHVEAFQEAVRYSYPVPPQTQLWIHNLDTDLRSKLSPILGAARTVREAVTEFRKYLEATNKNSTVGSYNQTLREFVSRFGSTDIRSLAARPIDDWLGNFRSARNTVAKHAKHVRALLAWIAAQYHTTPVRILTSSVVQPGQKHYLPIDLRLAWADAAGNGETRSALLVAIWTGCRVPSELQTLTHGSVRWNDDTLDVQDSKRTLRAARGPPVIRPVPLFPELADVLREIWNPEAPPSDLLLPRLASDPDRFLRECRSARDELGQSWPRLFTSVRASRETDLIDLFGARAACKWIGNSARVAERNYDLESEKVWGNATSPTYDSAEQPKH